MGQKDFDHCFTEEKNIEVKTWDFLKMEILKKN